MPFALSTLTSLFVMGLVSQYWLIERNNPEGGLPHSALLATGSPTVTALTENPSDIFSFTDDPRDLATLAKAISEGMGPLGNYKLQTAGFPRIQDLCTQFNAAVVFNPEPLTEVFLLPEKTAYVRTLMLDALKSAGEDNYVTVFSFMAPQMLGLFDEVSSTAPFPFAKSTLVSH